MPRLFGSFVALCLYRWEIILRETAVMGLLGIATLGFFVDSAVAELRLDRALVLLIGAGLLTAAVDWTSRAIQSRMGAGTLRLEQAQRAIAPESGRQPDPPRVRAYR